jgi:hypothetical protein
LVNVWRKVEFTLLKELQCIYPQKKKKHELLLYKDDAVDVEASERNVLKFCQQKGDAH